MDQRKISKGPMDRRHHREGSSRRGAQATRRSTSLLHQLPALRLHQLLQRRPLLAHRHRDPRRQAQRRSRDHHRDRLLQFLPLHPPPLAPLHQPRHRHCRSPNLFSLSYYTTVAGDTWLYDGRPKFKNPIHTISLCAGGTHCIVFEVRDVNVKHFRSKILDDIVPLKRLLEDRRITFVGIGMEKFVKKAKEELGIDRVANPRELKSLVDEAFGKNKLGPRVNPEVEEMAELVLDGMKNVRKKNKKVKDMDWGREDVTEDALMYATRDAFFAFEIGKKCLDLIARKRSS